MSQVQNFQRGDDNLEGQGVIIFFQGGQGEVIFFPGVSNQFFIILRILQVF